MRKRKSVVVELTSLLDVIFIMLFMVMNRSQTAAAEAQNTAAEEISAAQVQVEEMQQEVDSYREIISEVEAERAELEAMNSKLNSYEVFDEYATIVSLPLASTIASAKTVRINLTDFVASSLAGIG